MVGDLVGQCEGSGCWILWGSVRVQGVRSCWAV